MKPLNKHFFYFRGKDFRRDFQKLSALKAFFPNAVTLALTATATPVSIENLLRELCIKDCAVVKSSPDRSNVFLEVCQRLGNNKGLDSYRAVFDPMIVELNNLKQSYPLTIMYMPLKYCGFAYRYFDSKVHDKFCHQLNLPENCLFAQFHAESTNDMKDAILNEIKKVKPNIRLIFATTALGMGVDAPSIKYIIHVSPPANIESYVQEIGRAGRDKSMATARLYFNNSDIAKNKTHIDVAMKEYCLTKTCLRTFILQYFGFKCKVQDLCCCNCEDTVEERNEMSCENNVVRKVNVTEKQILQKSIKKILSSFNSEYSFLCAEDHQIDEGLSDKIINDVEFIESVDDLLYKYDIWDEDCCYKIFDLIENFSSHVNI